MNKPTHYECNIERIMQSCWEQLDDFGSIRILNHTIKTREEAKKKKNKKTKYFHKKANQKKLNSLLVQWNSPKTHKSEHFFVHNKKTKLELNGKKTIEIEN